jgi:DNA-binding NtrC family response regulator
MPKRIVIVDDEPNIGPSLKLILEREGYAVVTCSSATEFRGNGAHRRADAYLLDVKLPDGNGIDLLRFLRHNDNTAPVIMISGTQQHRGRRRSNTERRLRLPRETSGEGSGIACSEERAGAGQPAPGERTVP